MGAHTCAKNVQYTEDLLRGGIAYVDFDAKSLLICSGRHLQKWSPVGLRIGHMYYVYAAAQQGVPERRT
jgi:hypothetical protein